MTIPFGNRKIGDGEPVLVIAEIGINHEGNAETCARMIEAAAAAGADSIKLQTIDADANYVRGTESHRLFSSCGLSREETANMFRLTRDLGMEPFTTVGDLKSLEWIECLDPAGHKISSGLLTTHPIVARAAQTGRTLIISTGLAEIADVEEAVAVARKSGPSPIALLQCTSLYQAPFDSLNLAAIRELAARFSVVTGFSDHSLGVEAAPLAVAAGAKIIEKHFSLDATRSGYDHGISLEPDDFGDMVKRIRLAERMLGHRDKRLSPDEAARAPVYHRVLVALRPIVRGEAFDHTNLGFKRPLPGRLGLAPSHYDTVLGKTASRALVADEPVNWSDIGDGA